ncbi:hypothetical protein AAF712_011071 [Marasmius tenuissimus]|uniref:AB hydrolase-1 domain-containing protein n=1 Tax=Marasmius tenuissimus TaxID=585030 RepID=A0ABR2ZM28_9AGAR
MVLTQKSYQIVEDINVSFTDTGTPPNSKDYTTIVIIHGMGFGAACFERLQSQARSSQSNLRIVVLSRRGYPGSTPFSASELEALQVRDDGKEAPAQEFHDDLGRHLWLFLRKFVEEERVPPVRSRRGGIVVMGWSLGVAFPMAAFSNPDSGLMIYDPSYTTLGYSIPSNIDASNLYVPWMDPDAQTPQGVFDKFLHWVCSQYRYEYADGNLSPTAESFIQIGTLKRTKECFADLLSKNELEKLTYPQATFPGRGDMSLFAHQPILNKAARKVLFDSHIAKTFFPNLSITYLYPPRSPWMCVLAYMETKRIYEGTFRGYSFHQVHYTDPKGFLRSIEDALV